MNDFQINQNVFIVLPPELYGIPLENGGTITKGIVITKKHTEQYIVKIKLQEESTLITLNKNDIHISLKDGLDTIAQKFQSSLKVTENAVD